MYIIMYKYSAFRINHKSFRSSMSKNFTVIPGSDRGSHSEQTVMDIIHCTTAGEMAGQAGHDERGGDSRQGRTRGGGATEGRGDARS